MTKQQWIASIAGVVLASSAAVSIAAVPDSANEVTRESTERPRGNDNERPGDRQRRGGRLTADTTDDVLAASGSGRKKVRTPGGSGCDDAGDVIEHPDCISGNHADDKQFVARESTEAPRGRDNERPNDRQRRGGRA